MTQTHGRLDCPICGRRLERAAEWAPNHTSDHLQIDCAFCGAFIMMEDAINDAVDRMILPHPQRQTFPIAHQIRRLQAHRSRAAEIPIVSSAMLQQWWNGARLPSPAEQVDNLVRLLGDLGRGDPGQVQPISFAHYGAVLGTPSEEALSYIQHQAMCAGLADAGFNPYADGDQRYPIGRLTLAGWRRYEELQRGETSSRTAFMAMKFGDPTLDGVVADHFRPAVEAAGFRLKRLDDEQPAGLIDDHLRVEIKRARFLIADLSHANKGAYWEAGYAEGLGKPVIYTCERSVFESDDTTKRPHFDTNHHLTVVWEPDKPEVAARKLKDTIRATLPDARMADD